MVLIREQSACATENMQEMQSSYCQRRSVGCGSDGRRSQRQMWVVGVILLLTTIIFTVNAEQSHAQRPTDGPQQVHLQVSQNTTYIIIIFVAYFSKNKNGNFPWLPTSRILCGCLAKMAFLRFIYFLHASSLHLTFAYALVSKSNGTMGVNLRSTVE